VILYPIFEIAFWVSCGVIGFIYVGYPVTLALMSLFARRPVKQDENFVPPVTIMISAFNERLYIGATIENKLALDYPSDKLQILVTSDGSVDGTDDIIKSFADQRVRYFRQEPRQGKTAAINRMVLLSVGEIIVFSDANSIYEKDVIRKLVRNFADPLVGYVTGKMVYVDKTGSIIGSGCTAYMRYENLLRDLETNVWSVIGVDGGIDAVRKSLFISMTPEAIPDFVLPLQVISHGSRVVYEKEALVNETTLSQPAEEWRMRVRVILRSFHALNYMRMLLNPFRFPLASFQIWNHKILRYMAGVFQASALALNVFLASGSIIYQSLLAVHFLFYFLAIIGSSKIVGRFVPGAQFAFYFCLLNGSALVALARFCRGDRQVVWTPRKG